MSWGHNSVGSVLAQHVQSFGFVVHAYGFSLWEVEAGESVVQGHP